MQDNGTKLIFIGCLVAITLLTIFHPTVSKPARPDATVITLSFWGSYEEWNMWREIIHAFEAKNPDIWVKMMYIPGNYDDKIQLLMAADSAPDVMLLQDEPFPGYVRYGKLLDLTSRAYGPHAPADWKHDFWPTAAESFIDHGRVMGVPLWGGNCLIYYNKTMFRELGVAPPKDNWTFDDFIKTAQELTRDLNGDGKPDTFGFLLPGWVYFLPFTWGYGAHYLNPSRTDWAFTGPKAVAATRLFQDLLYKYHVAPTIQDIPQDEQSTMFMTGRIGMLVGGPWTGLGFTTAGVDFDVVHVPIGPTGHRYTRVTWDALTIAKNSKHPNAAWRFVSFCIGDEAQDIIGKYDRSVPSLIRAKKSFIESGRARGMGKFIDALSYARMQPISYKWDAMSQVMNEVYEQLLLDKITPQQAVNRMARRMHDEHVFPIKEAQ